MTMRLPGSPSSGNSNDRTVTLDHELSDTNICNDSIPQKSVIDDAVGSFYIEFEEGDPRNPANFSQGRKWAITIAASAFTGIVAAAASSYSVGYDSMIPELNCTEFQATLGLSVYALGFGVVPLFTSSFSEEFGRQPLYIVCSFCFFLTNIMVALAPNIQTVIVARALAGAFGSTGATLVGGTVADIWQPNKRGLPMSIFSFAAVGSTGLGPLIAGWIAANPHLQWRWIQWIHSIFTGIYFIVAVLIMKETRSAIILRRLARRKRKETGDNRYRARVEEGKPGLLKMTFISCTRPIHLLLTEPTVICFSLWVGFAWGILYCMIESVSPVFHSLYNFGVGETGTVFATLAIGSMFGLLANIYQEKLYRKHVARKGPEARLYIALVAAPLIPLGMFIYAWTAFPNIPWIAPVIGLTIFMFCLFVVYVVVFTYLADCYGTYASSALAGQSLCRNLAGTAFPLFTNQLYARLTYKWANTLFALIAVAMIPIPFVLFFYGSSIRQRSKVCRKIVEAEQEREQEQEQERKHNEDA